MTSAEGNNQTLAVLGNKMAINLRNARLEDENELMLHLRERCRIFRLRINSASPWQRGLHKGNHFLIDRKYLSMTSLELRGIEGQLG